MITAKDGALDEAEGLDTGADDYLRKPFSFPVLVARVHALLRRAALGDPPPLQVGDLRLEPGARRVLRDGVEVPLTAREFALLAWLIRRAGRLLAQRATLTDQLDEALLDRAAAAAGQLAEGQPVNLSTEDVTVRVRPTDVSGRTVTDGALPDGRPARVVTLPGDGGTVVVAG